MDYEGFIRDGRKIANYLVNYLNTVKSYPVTPDVNPGYLAEFVPSEIPKKPESLDTILEDVQNHIIPGLTHWAHPKFHAYFPSGHSYPSVLASLLSDGLGIVGFSWISSPSCTELEFVMMDWMGRLLGLPPKFFNYSKEMCGGGVIQSSSSDSMLSAMLSARFYSIKILKQQHPFVEEGVLLTKLIAYCSTESHSSIEKAAMLSFVKLRILDSNDNYQLDGEILFKAIREDRSKGLVPFFVGATMGTMSCCSCDAIHELGQICEGEGIWLHVDAAYAGAAMILPEFKYLHKGLRYADSINFNPQKWLLISMDCSCFWVQNKMKYIDAFVIDPVYLQHKQSSSDLRHWGIHLTRRFRSVKIWFVLRMYGVKNLQKYIRNHIRLAKLFEQLVRSDSRFEICNTVTFGLVCFRLKGSNRLNENFLNILNTTGQIYMTPASLKDQFVIRFVVCHPDITDEDIQSSWAIIKDRASVVGSDITEESVDEMEEEKIKTKRNTFVRMSSDASINPYSLKKADSVKGFSNKMNIIRPFATNKTIDIADDEMENFIGDITKRIG